MTIVKVGRLALKHAHFVLLPIGLLFLSSFVVGESHQVTCDISGNKIVELEWDADTKEYTYIDDTENEVESDNGTDRYRHLHEDYEYYQRKKSPHILSSIDIDRRRVENILDAEGQTPYDRGVIQVRSCHCVDPFVQYDRPVYCPITYTHCLVQSSSNLVDSTAGCFSRSRQQTVVRTIRPIVLVLFGVTFAALLGTRKGWHAINYTIGLLFPSRNEYIANQLLRRNRFIVGLYVRNYMRDHIDELGEDYLPEYNYRYGRRRRHNNNGAQQVDDETNPTPPPPPNQLTLKTRIYRRHRANTAVTAVTDNMSTTASSLAGDERGDFNSNFSDSCSSHCRTTEDDDNDLESGDNHDCVICFSELRPGDRVGALPCNHIFHVECLKEWLSCRNVCPLCLQDNVATPQQQQRRRQQQQSNTNSTVEESMEDTPDDNGQEEIEEETTSTSQEENDDVVDDIEDNVATPQQQQRQQQQQQQSNPSSTVKESIEDTPVDNGQAEIEETTSAQLGSSQEENDDVVDDIDV